MECCTIPIPVGYVRIRSLTFISGTFSTAASRCWCRAAGRPRFWFSAYARRPVSCPGRRAAGSWSPAPSASSPSAALPGIGCSDPPPPPPISWAGHSWRPGPGWPSPETQSFRPPASVPAGWTATKPAVAAAAKGSNLPAAAGPRCPPRRPQVLKNCLIPTVIWN